MFIVALVCSAHCSLIISITTAMALSVSSANPVMMKNVLNCLSCLISFSLVSIRSATLLISMSLSCWCWRSRFSSLWWIVGSSVGSIYSSLMLSGWSSSLWLVRLLEVLVD